MLSVRYPEISFLDILFVQTRVHLWSGPAIRWGRRLDCIFGPARVHLWSRARVCWLPAGGRVRGFLREGENETFENFENPNSLSSSRSSDRWRRRVERKGLAQTTDFGPQLHLWSRARAWGGRREGAREARPEEGEMETFENSDIPNRLSSSRSSDRCGRRRNRRGVAQTTDS